MLGRQLPSSVIMVEGYGVATLCGLFFVLEVVDEREDEVSD